MESNTTSKQAVPHQQLPRASILTGPSKQLQSLSGTPSMLRSYHVTGVGSDVKVIQMHARLGEPKEGHNNIVPPPKTRNFTQVPSLKSSPLQKRP